MQSNKNLEEEKSEQNLEKDYISIKSYTSMVSEQGEVVKFSKLIEPFENFNLDGEKIYKTKLLERWLIDVEKEMK